MNFAGLLLFIDGISLNYVGETKFDPSLFALQAAVTGGQSKLEYTFSNELKEKLQQVVEAGDDLVKSQSSDKDANVAATEAINCLLIEVNENIDAYKRLQDFLDGTMSDVIAKYDSSAELSDFAGELADDKDAYTNAMEGGEYTTAQINEIINGFSARVAAAVKDALDKIVAQGGEANLDITCLFEDKNLGYANSTVEGWKNETGTTAFLSRVQTAEVWNQSNFNVYQTLENLPAGVYELRVPGFYRTADNVTNYAQYSEQTVTGTVYAYVGGNKTLLHNVAELAAESDAYHTAGADDADATVATLFVPNSNDNAHYFFYDQDNVDVMNIVTGVLAEEGTLTIGVKGADLESNSWAVWGGMNLIYKGTVGMEAALYAEMQAKCEEANDLSDVEAMVLEAGENLNSALTQAGDCSETSDLETLKAAIKALDEAIAYANESKSLYDQIQEVFSVFSEYLVPMVDSDEPTYTSVLDEVAAAMDEGFETNEQITANMQKLQDGWATYVQYPVLNAASEEQPADITAAILNSGFEGIMNSQTEQSGDGNADYWTRENEGGSFGYQFGIYENYNSTNFNIYQTIKGLAPGYYRVKVQGFYRSGSNQGNADAVAGDSANVVTLYANEASVTLNNQLQNGTDGAMYGVGDEPAITVGENAEYYVPNNREALAAIFANEEPAYYWNSLDAVVAEDGILTIGLKKETSVEGDWCPFDNFQLYYLGAKAPTAVESVAAANMAPKSIVDLSGRKVSKAIKGIYIVDGKKCVK